MTREPLLTLPQALAALECSADELDGFIRDGRVAAYRIADGRYDLNPPSGPWEPAPPPAPTPKVPRRRRGRPREPVEDRFWAKVNHDGPISEHRPDLGPCWLWTASRNAAGYGSFRVSHPYRRTPFAHRFAYELVVGPIPDGLQIDHLCRNPSCVNPAHLEPVTGQVNVLRGIGPAAQQAKQTYCKRGHPLFGENLYMAPGSRRRVCRTCVRDSNRRRANPNRSGEDA